MNRAVVCLYLAGSLSSAFAWDLGKQQQPVIKVAAPARSGGCIGTLLPTLWIAGGGGLSMNTVLTPCRPQHLIYRPFLSQAGAVARKKGVQPPQKVPMLMHGAIWVDKDGVFTLATSEWEVYHPKAQPGAKSDKEGGDRPHLLVQHGKRANGSSLVWEAQPALYGASRVRVVGINCFAEPALDKSKQPILSQTGEALFLDADLQPKDLPQVTYQITTTAVTPDNIDGLESVLCQLTGTSCTSAGATPLMEASAAMEALRKPAPSLELAADRVPPGAFLEGNSISLPEPAAKDTTVTIESPTSSIVAVPNSLVIPAGQTSATFNLAISPSAPALGISIIAHVGDDSAKASLQVAPFSCSTNLVATAIIGGKPPFDINVTLSAQLSQAKNDPLADAPATIFQGPGQDDDAPDAAPDPSPEPAPAPAVQPGQTQNQSDTGCSELSSDNNKCSLTSAPLVRSYDKEFWDLGLGLAIPGVREPQYASSNPAAPPTSKLHTDFYGFLNLYPFKSVAWKNSYGPHLVTGIPVTGQPLYRPFFGMGQNIAGWKWAQDHNFPFQISFIAGIVYMNQQVVVSNPAGGLLISHARTLKPMFGIEVPVKQLISKIPGLGSSSSKSQSSGKGGGN